MIVIVVRVSRMNVSQVVVIYVYVIEEMRCA